VIDIIKLELPSNYLLNELDQHDKQKNRPKYLGDIISRFILLGYNKETGFLKCLGQCHSNKHTFAKERMPIVQVLLVLMSLRYCQIIWSEPRAEISE